MIQGVEPGFTKIFESLLDSTVWQESKETRLVWIAMLLMKNRLHVVEASVPGLAKRAGVTVQECEAALATLRAPDPYSRTKDFEGRRIEDVPGGWKVLNGEIYRQKMSPDERKAYQAAYMREYRKRRASTKHDAACNGAKQAISDNFRDMGLQ
jgi:hypothetical protein